MKILKIKIHVAQNVGKVWISKENTFLALFGAIPGHFMHVPKNNKNMFLFAYFPWWANWPYSPGWGSCAGVICKSVCQSDEHMIIMLGKQFWTCALSCTSVSCLHTPAAAISLFYLQQYVL